MRVGARNWASCAALVAATWVAVSADSGPKFYPDDPIGRDIDTEDASRVIAHPLSAAWELAEHQFEAPGDPTPNVRALNVNSIDEVPDSSWFTNRMTPRPILLPELTAVMADPGPARGQWTVVSSKSDGTSPGFTIQDARGTVWFLKFDPLDHPEMASGAEVVASRLLRVLGYHVPDNHVAFLRPEQVVVGPSALYTPYLAKPRPMRADDVARLLRGAARSADGSYRVLASLALPGRPVGGFRFYGTRSDDPNDIVPHEHRRELRGLAVVAAWINHVDARGANTLDTVVTAGDRTFVRHHLLDFGSTFGSASLRERPYWEGHAYAFNGGGRLVRDIATLGFVAPAFRGVPVFEHPALGRLPALEYAWDPRAWKSRVPNPAFTRMRADDAFWAARRVAAFTDDMLRAVVGEARYSDPAAAEYLATWLMRRRDAIARAYLPAVNPIVDVRLSHGRRADVRERGGDGRCRTGPGLLRRRLDALRQPVASDYAHRQHERAGVVAARPRGPAGVAGELRAGEPQGHRWGASVMEPAGAGVVQARCDGMDARRPGALAVTGRKKITPGVIMAAAGPLTRRVAAAVLAWACGVGGVQAQQPEPLQRRHSRRSAHPTSPRSSRRSRCRSRPWPRSRRTA